jgi:signal transduction histidine kinase
VNDVYRTKILLVDDKPENLLALASLIDAPDVQLLQALSGDEALGLLLAHDFALAILDVQMPAMNGFELARLMRTAERSRGIPIIFVTASERDQRSIFEGYDSGAVDYLLKPLDPHIVRTKVRVFVELDQKTRTLAAKLAEVETLRDAAEAANRAKSRFLANMSHEIRTPLGAVLGFADLLRSQVDSPADRESCITAIERNGRHLLKLIDDILDLSKIEAERVEAERVAFSTAELLDDIRAVHSPAAREKSLELEIAATGVLPARIVSDPVRLKQILNNLVGNALKFTARGRISVTVSLEERTGEPPLLKFEIADTGRGLSELEIMRLFQPFMQADSSTTRKYGGTGLGLVISKQLAGILGGDLILQESQPGAGTVFVVTIDPGPIEPRDLVAAGELVVRRAGARVAATDDARALGGLSILIADDAPDKRRLIGRILTNAGAAVEAVEDGVQAIERASAKSFDVVLMDIQMPNKDGYEATKALRCLGYTKPIVALTAHAMKEELERCLRAGCDRHLSKPVSKQDLISTVQDLTAPKSK